MTWQWVVIICVLMICAFSWISFGQYLGAKYGYGLNAVEPSE